MASKLALMVHVAALGLSSAVLLHSGRPSGLKLHGKSIATITMQMYRADCTSTGRTHLPGAGMTPDSIEPFKVVLKDGFYGVDCVDDYMFTHGDKFGDNKFSYEIGETANVSIVHYSAFVAKESQESMTPEVCFSFCRTVPDMGYFGIRNGKDCYCTPYFQSVEGDDSMCDVVCEGDGTRVCGSKTKSSVFGMHMCDNTGADLAASVQGLDDATSDLTPLQSKVSTASAGMQSAAALLQDMFGKAADPAAADLMQSAKVLAGKLEKAAGDAQALSVTMGKAKAGADRMATSDFSVSATASAADAAMKNVKALTVKGEATVADLTSQLNEATPNATSANISQEYYPVMYFVDKSAQEFPTTCGGTASHAPLIGTLNTCAQACNQDIHECMGFSFFPTAGTLASPEGLCFLMSHFKTVTYYTKCSAPGAIDPEEVKCMAKLSKVEGTSLAPDGTGKCKECFTEATKADRCMI